jgi:sulfhydrogenase subunit gamma (sulfur reductase)
MSTHKFVIKDSGYQIKQSKVLRTKQLTEMEKLFEIGFMDGEFLDHEPGQFVEVSLFGAGEAPISICSSPTQRGSFELCVRAVGKLTQALHELDVGDEIGIRGPFGKGFPVSVLEGNDLILIAGGLGLAPLRSLINFVIDNRRDFGSVTILLGCNSPKNIPFGDEIELWSKRIDVNFSCTVDKADPDWKGNVGVITTLIPGVTLDAPRTFAIAVGPPIMYKYVITELINKGIPEDQILVSLERHMKCGLGKCGHCQIHNVYCCQDGPVFKYSRIKKLRGAI